MIARASSRDCTKTPPAQLGEAGPPARSRSTTTRSSSSSTASRIAELRAAARCAEASGASVLITRTRRAADVTPAAVRASAGALLHLPLARVANIPRALDRLQDAGFTVVGLDGDAEESIFDAPCPEGRVALVVGSEGDGMSRLVRERCDVLVALPMRGRVGSLNASASLAAVLYGYVLPSRRP
jgi:23S rRNA (guanosine2251-2'-O)-methyltransferase